VFIEVHSKERVSFNIFASYFFRSFLLWMRSNATAQHRRFSSEKQLGCILGPLPETEANSTYWAFISRFHLKSDIDSSHCNVLFWIKDNMWIMSSIIIYSLRTYFVGSLSRQCPSVERFRNSVFAERQLWKHVILRNPEDGDNILTETSYWTRDTRFKVPKESVFDH
jgi:hypothetical protein